MDIDTVVKVLSKTIFAPSFCLLLPLTVLSQVKDRSHPAFLGSLIWTALVCLSSAWTHADRVYSARGSWFFSPPKIVWEDQLVVITGGGSGIGALLAETLALRNVHVIVLTKDAPAYVAGSDNISTYICDVSNHDQVMVVAARIQAEIGDPTVIVNNAGIVKGKLLLDLTEEDIKDTFGSNTLAQFWTLKAFLPAILKRGSGHVVCVSSILGLVGAAQMSSKAALISLHQSLRFELDNRYRRPKVLTTLVLPSFILTSLFSKLQLSTSGWFQFLAPPIQPHTVVKEIIDTLDAQESRIIRLPWYSNMARFMGPGVGVMPKWLQDTLQRISGADFAMSNYGPKPDAAQRFQ